MVENSEKENISKSAFRLLSTRNRSKQELYELLVKKGFREHLVTEIINQFEKKMFISDQKFAFEYAEHLIRVKKLGRIAVNFKFTKHKIPSSIVQPIINSLYDKYLPEKTIRETLIKLKYDPTGTMNQKNRILNYLKRKGFEWDEIAQTINSH